MFLSYLLYYTTFIVLFLKADVLLGDKEKSGFLNRLKVKTFKSGNTKGRNNKHGEVINLGRNTIETISSNNSSMKSAKTRSRFRLFLRKKPVRQEFNLEKLELHINRFSLSGKIWHYVWKICIIQNCLAHNKFSMLQKNFLIEINFYRIIHRSKPLVLDNYLTYRADYAARRSASIGKWIFSDKDSSGINYATISNKLSPLLIYKWYKENKKYNYNALFGKSDSIHFTNLVWKKTLAIGIGIAQKNSDLYICLRFFPEGSRSFKFQQNVLKPRYSFLNTGNLFNKYRFIDFTNNF
uniref:SCP domain-containing protein n=1 Tax=Strongyloides venezuelensis TaxID=75913 RepID=A0A0K0G206_STRVS